MPSKQQRRQTKMISSCANKKKYDNEKAVNARAGWLNKKGIAVRPYRCSICRGWHLCGRSPVKRVYELLDELKKEKQNGK